jgi:hypothetical protein
LIINDLHTGFDVAIEISTTLFYKCSVQESKRASGPAEKAKTSPWAHTSKNNIVRNVASCRYYARINVGGKDTWKSLKIDKISVAEQRLRDLVAAARKTAAPIKRLESGTCTLADCLRAL